MPPMSAPVRNPIVTSLLCMSTSLRVLMCNDASLRPDPSRPGYHHALGDPTEGALIVAAAKAGLWRSDLEQSYPRVAEVPFDSERKRMTTVHRVPSAPAAIPVSLREVLEQRAGGTATP